MGLSSTVLRVRVFRGGELLTARSFVERHVVVGRDPLMADLVIVSRQMSREHALLEHDGERMFVHDMASTNGLHVNGIPAARAEVNAGDNIRLGEYELQMELSHGPATDAADAPPRRPTEHDLQLTAADAIEDFFVVDSPFEGLALTDADSPMSRRTLRPDETAALIKAVQDESAEADVPETSAVVDPDDAADDFTPTWSLTQVLAQPINPDVIAGAKRGGVAVEVVICRGERVDGYHAVTGAHSLQLNQQSAARRWQRRIGNDMSLRVRVNRRDDAEVTLPEKATFQVHRGDRILDATQGVREGWTRRRRGRLYLSLQRFDTLLVDQGPLTYQLRFVPHHRPRLRRRALPRPMWQRVRKWLALLAFAALAHVGLLAAATPWHTRHAWAPTLGAVPWVEYVAGSSVNRWDGPAMSVAPTLAGMPEAHGEGFPHLPGGSRGFHIFGLMGVGLATQPNNPPASGDLHLSRAAALLRGEAVSLRDALPSPRAGHTWVLQKSGALPAKLADARLKSDDLLKVLHRDAAALEACYATVASPGFALSGNVAMAFVLSKNGTVKHVQDTVVGTNTPLPACFSAQVKRNRFNSFKGDDLAVEVTLTFMRSGFE